MVPKYKTRYITVDTIRSGRYLDTNKYLVEQFSFAALFNEN